MSQLSIQGSVLRDDIERQGYSYIEHGIPAEAVDTLIRAYAAFTDEVPDPPLNVVDAMIPAGDDAEVVSNHLDDLVYENDTARDWHKYRTNFPAFAKPGGYTNRSLQTRALRELRGLDLVDDPKEYYHFHPNSYSKMVAMHQQHGWDIREIPEQVKALDMRFQIVHRLGAEAITAAYQQLEETHPELLPKHFGKDDLQASPVRLLFYHPGQGDTLAAGHFDKAQSTIQIAESHIGLRVRDPGTGQMKMIERSPDQGVFFLGKSWHNPNSYPNSPLRPGWHDVINTDEFNEGRTLHGQNVARWAIIFFANSLASGTILDKKLTHTEQTTQVLGP